MQRMYNKVGFVMTICYETYNTRSIRNADKDLSIFCRWGLRSYFHLLDEATDSKCVDKIQSDSKQNHEQQ